MNAISPFALADIRKSAQALGGAVREAASFATTHKGQSAGPDSLHAQLGKLSGVDFARIASRIAKHATGGEIRGIGAAQGASESVRATLTHAARTATDETASRAAFAVERAIQAHHLLANAPPALPGAPAVQAPENLPSPDLVRNTYAILIRLT